MAYQVSIFLENKLGHFEKVTGVLAEENINIRTMTLTHTANGWGILNLVVTDPERAKVALIEKGLSATLREIVAIEMDDKPGGLDLILKDLAKAEINFTNAYGRMLQENNKAYLVIDVQDIPDAAERLKKINVAMASDNAVYGNHLK